MKKLLYLTILIILLLAGIIWISNNRGYAEIEWLGYEIRTTPIVLIGIALIMASIAAILDRFWIILYSMPSYIRNKRNERVKNKGLSSITKGLTALAAGDTVEALEAAGDIKKLLKNEPISLLIQAQAEILKGNNKSAEKFFVQMLKDKEVAFIAHRRLAIKAIDEKNSKKAYEHLKEAVKLHPKALWVQKMLLSVAIIEEDWQKATKIMKQLIKYSDYDKHKIKQLKSSLSLTQARIEAKQGKIKNAIKLASQAYKNNPKFVPAGELLARLQAASGDLDKALKTLKKSWTLCPHPLLASSFNIITSNTPSVKLLQKAQDICQAQIGNTESYIFLSETSIRAKLWEKAEDYLKPLLEHQPPIKKVMMMMANICSEGKKNEDEARKWRVKASENNTLEYEWQCQLCFHKNPEWTIICPNCNEIDNFKWHPSETLHKLPVEISEQKDILLIN